MDDKNPSLDGDKIEVKIGGSKPPESDSSIVDSLPEVPEVVASDVDSESSAVEVTDVHENEQVESTGSQPTVEVEPSTATLQEVELQEVPEQPAAVFPQPKKSRKKLVFSLLSATFVLAAAGCVGAWLLLKDDTAKTASTDSTPKASVQLMGGEVSLIDGTAQVSSDNENWKPLAVSDEIKEGNYYKTDADSRLVVSMDDGSALRLNSDTTVKLDSLATTNVAVTNETGEMYSRLVKSDRTFTVNVEDEQYQALGTAYVTLNTEETKGVEVYESTVKAKTEDLEVPEGNYFYTDTTTTKKEDEVATLSVTDLKKDTFVKWNYELDKKETEFKDKLGYLENIDKETSTKDDDKEDDDSTTASLTLSGAKYDTGVKLSWALKELTATKGFKVLKSLDANPTFGASNTDAVYVSDSSSRSYSWTIKDGKTYHFRVCIYNGSGCSKYSNDVSVTAPKSESTSGEPSGTLTLVSKGGSKVGWTLSSGGSAPNGFKLVYSRTTLPEYPGDSYYYYSDPSTRSGDINKSSGKYYVRICMYTGSGCVNYSKQIELNL